MENKDLNEQFVPKHLPCNGVIYKLWGFLFAMEQAGRRVATVVLAARETLWKTGLRAQASSPPLGQIGSEISQLLCP